MLATTDALLAVAHVRVSLEDNLYLEQGVLASNVELVEKTVRVIRELDYEPATTAEARSVHDSRVGITLNRRPVRPLESSTIAWPWMIRSYRALH
ncbi:3-keto-5-aminohexanoate cleavage protein [Bradyrhizobium yuanmingense]|uniref:3-keto-5-aminohexanoate cleavage protein n=1 Tax=Bradyrhizobium yuanmingense TaxID=108015 RepID=UPI0009DB27F9|nr:3-keto-5-aminohexanoate cleavage protein [Bradyrhizobium yuanmingense]